MSFHESAPAMLAHPGAWPKPTQEVPTCPTYPSPVVADNPQAASGPRTVYPDRQDVPEVFRRAFPGYRGRQFCVKSAESVTLDANYWSGGARYTYRGVDLVTGAVLPPDCDEYGNPFVRPEVPTVALEPNRAIVCHKVFCGKDMGLTIYGHLANLAKLLPKPAELTGHERIVLGVHRSAQVELRGYLELSLPRSARAHRDHLGGVGYREAVPHRQEAAQQAGCDHHARAQRAGL